MTQLNLLIGERANLLSVNRDRSDELGVFEHRNSQKRAGPTGLDKPNERREAVDVGLICPDVGDMNHLPCASDTPKRKLRAWVNDGFTTALFDMRCRSMQCDGPESSALAKPHHAEFCLADARGLLEHCLEHRFQLAGRTRDDAQHLRGRSLLLQRLGESLPGLSEFAGPDFELRFQFGQ